MIARLVRSADFERVLRTRSRVSSAHFALHHVAERPSSPAKPLSKRLVASASASVTAAAEVELSTGELTKVTLPVDDLPRVAPDALWLGTVVPKRHARRSVTRTLLKRQIRAAITEQAAALAAGLWVVRLRAPFDRAQFVSAASEELKRAAREELARLIDSAAQRTAAARA